MFIRSIGRCLVNGYGFDLYENEDGTATVRPVKLYRDLPKSKWVKFDSLESAEKAIENIAGDTSGAERVRELIEVWN